MIDISKYVVGAKVRVLADEAWGADVRKGDIGRINAVRSGGIEVMVGKHGWSFRPGIDVELVEPDTEESRSAEHVIIPPTTLTPKQEIVVRLAAGWVSSSTANYRGLMDERFIVNLATIADLILDKVK